MQKSLAAVYENESQLEEERKQWPGKGLVWQSRNTSEVPWTPVVELELGEKQLYLGYVWDIELTGLNSRLNVTMREMELSR